tara:strand:- start:99869 stop:100642 length:774 start_codon:yes stop_codon:yes gene_type:complete
MDIVNLLDNKLFIAGISAFGGLIVAVVAQYLLNKRGVFAYQVFHNRVGLSAEDAIYGSVKVTWNDTAVAHLYLSTVEITNLSMKDYESVVVRVFSNNTTLLTQRTEIVDSTRLIEFTQEYKNEIAVSDGGRPTENQFSLYRTQRDYFVPTMNRGQALRFEFLNAAHSEQQPAIWLDILHKGVVCKFQVAKEQVFGVPQSTAALVGTVVGLLGVGAIIAWVQSLPLAALLSFLIGWLVLVPGAYTIKAFRRLREVFAG